LLGDCIKQEIVGKFDPNKGDYQTLVLWTLDLTSTDEWQSALKYLKMNSEGYLGNIIAFIYESTKNLAEVDLVAINVVILDYLYPIWRVIYDSYLFG